MHMLRNIFLTLMFISITNLSFAEDTSLAEEINDYMEFTSYSDGTITQAQIEALGMENLLIIDSRSEARFTEGHLPKAMNIEWRQTLNERDKIPKDKIVVLYCDSGLLSSKAHFALKLVGYENVRVLLGGYQGWQ
jgi:rhodanese-related sulfurtransferase